MTRHRLAGVSSSVLGCLALLAACGQPTTTTTAATPPVDHRADDEIAIHVADTAWINAVAAKDTARIMAIYATDAVTLPPGMPLVTGKDATRKMWSGQMAANGFAMSFVPLKTVVQGDLAYEIGDYHFIGRGKGGAPVSSKGKYLTVWGRQANGKWRVLVDAPTTTL